MTLQGFISHISLEDHGLVRVPHVSMKSIGYCTAVFTDSRNRLTKLPLGFF